MVFLRAFVLLNQQVARGQKKLYFYFSSLFGTFVWRWVSHPGHGYPLDTLPRFHAQ